MYEKFYNLTGDPFRLVPDYRFSFGHTSYANAKAYLEYALYRGEGFITVTGPAGTGKTTLIHQVLAELDPSSVQVATLTGTQLEAQDLLHMVAASFDLPIKENTSKSDLLLSLGEFLQRQSVNGQRAIVVVDEAQDLPDEAVEELRLLSNLQANYQLLLQVFLVGQEKLRDLILRPEMDHLRQRIIAASHLEPLNLEDTVSYIEHRLRKVRWQGDPQISGSALDLIYKCSGGVPRRINLICSRLFLYSALDNKHQLILEDARKVITDLQRELLVDVDDKHGQDEDDDRDDGLSEEQLNEKYSIPRGLDKEPEPVQVIPSSTASGPSGEKTLRRPVKKKATARRQAQAAGQGRRNAPPGTEKSIAYDEENSANNPESMVAPVRPVYRPSFRPGRDERDRKRVWVLTGVFLLVGALVALAATVGVDRYGDAVSSLGETISDGYDQMVASLEDEISASQEPQQSAPGEMVEQDALEDNGTDLSVTPGLTEGPGENEELLASMEPESIQMVEPIVTTDESTEVLATTFDEGPQAGEQADVFLIERNEEQPEDTAERDESDKVAEAEAIETDAVTEFVEAETTTVLAEETPEPLTEVVEEVAEAEPVLAPEPQPAVVDKPQVSEAAVLVAAQPEKTAVEKKADPNREAAIRKRQQRLRSDAQQRLERNLTRPRSTPPAIPPKAVASVVTPPVLASVTPSVPKTRAAIPVSTGPKSNEFKLTLLERQWTSRGKPAVLLPSEATNCKENGRIINCWSLPRNINTKYGLAVYKVEATIKDFSTSGDFRLAYRTLVMIVGDEQEAETVRKKEPAPDSGKWQVTDHVMSCKLTNQASNVRCEDEKGVVRVYNSSSVTSLNAANQNIFQ